MTMKIAVNQEYEDEKRHFHSNRLLLIFVAKISQMWIKMILSTVKKYRINSLVSICTCNTDFLTATK